MIGADASAKAVVFSRYERFLELIGRLLTKTGLQCVQLSKNADGKSALERFREDTQCKILLTTFEIGGDLLDLSAASHAFLMEPGWNPITDGQAHARVQSLRQNKPTRMVKFISKGTIEEKIIEVLEGKQNSLVDGYCSSLEDLTTEEMVTLFSV
ncbi:putative DNA helicase [Arabidopsis thaliana]